MLKCEACGSTNLIKDGDCYVCQHCGGKFKDEQGKTVVINNYNSSVQPSAEESRQETQKAKMSFKKKFIFLNIIVAIIVCVVLVIVYSQSEPIYLI